MILSDEQSTALTLITDWIKTPIETKQIFILGGIAGSGKSSLLRYIQNETNLKAVSMVYTGQASLRMREVGITDAKTIHSTIFNTRKDADGNPIFTLKTLDELEEDTGKFDYFIVDECSMIDEKMFMNILSFKKKVLFVGDYEQLPPITGNAILDACDYRLTKCHRTALDNPIIWLSDKIRNGKFRLSNKTLGKTVLITNKEDVELMQRADQVISSQHKHRIRINDMLRRLDNKDEELVVGDKVVCKKNNWKFKSYSPLLKDNISLVNGMIGTIEEIHGNDVATFYDMYKNQHKIPTIKFDFKPQLDINTYNTVEADYSSLLNDRKQGYKFDTKELHFFEYAYCLSLYGCQGSEFKKVYYQHKPFGSVDIRKKQLYTAVTRSKEKLILQY